MLCSLLLDAGTMTSDYYRGSNARGLDPSSHKINNPADISVIVVYFVVVLGVGIWVSALVCL